MGAIVTLIVLAVLMPIIEIDQSGSRIDPRMQVN
jgi:hypothetical protein